MSRYQLACLVHRSWAVFLHRVKDQHVCLIARSKLTKMKEVVKLRRQIRSHNECFNLVATSLNRQAHTVIDVTNRANLVRLTIVGAHRSARDACSQNSWQQLNKVFTCRSVAQEDPHSFLTLFVSFIKSETFVIRFNAGCQVRVELRTAQTGRMTIDTAPTRRRDNFAEGRVAVNDSGIVHDFANANCFEF